MPLFQELQPVAFTPLLKEAPASIPSLGSQLRRRSCADPCRSDSEHRVGADNLQPTGSPLDRLIRPVDELCELRQRDRGLSFEQQLPGRSPGPAGWGGLTKSIGVQVPRWGLKPEGWFVSSRKGHQEGGQPLGQQRLPGFETHPKPEPAALGGFHNGQLGATWIQHADEISVAEYRSGQNSALWIHKGKQGNDASSLHGIGEIALLLGRKTREPSRQDLAALCDEFLEQINVFVVDRLTRLDRRKTLFEKGA